jgi:hypothetical protein
MAKPAKSPKTPKAKKPKKAGRAAQILQAYRIARKSDPKLPLILWGVFALGALGGFLVMYLVFRDGNIIFPIIFGLLTGTLITLIVFGRRAQNSAIAQIEGKPGAAASVLGMLRRGWKTDPMVAFNKHQDIVTRLVGPPGIVLIGEGNPNRVKSLLISERKKHERVASEVPIHEVIVGDGPGEVPLRKLTRHVTKLGKSLKGNAMTDLLQRLKALDAQRGAIPMPKGPVPTSMKGMRGNMRGR